MRASVAPSTPSSAARPQPLEGGGDAHAGPKRGVTGQVHDRKQPSVLDVERPLPLAGVLDDDVVHEPGRWLGGERQAEHPALQRRPVPGLEEQLLDVEAAPGPVDDAPVEQDRGRDQHAVVARAREPSLDRPLPVLDRARREGARGRHPVRVELPADHPHAVGHVGGEAAHVVTDAARRQAAPRLQRAGRVPARPSTPCPSRRRRRAPARGGHGCRATSRRTRPGEVPAISTPSSIMRAISASATAEVTSLTWDGDSSGAVEGDHGRVEAARRVA